jgi:hypothetical protein
MKYEVIIGLEIYPGSTSYIFSDCGVGVRLIK